MAVMPMKRLHLVALKRDRKKILELLQRESVVEISADDAEDDVFRKEDMSKQSAEFMKAAEAADTALGILEKLAPGEKRSSFAGREPITLSQYDEALPKIQEATEAADRIVSLDKKIAELRAEIPKLEMEETQLEPWRTFDLPLDFQGTKTTKTIAGSVPSDVPLEEIRTKISEVKPELEKYDATIISHSQEQTCVFFVVAKDEAEDLEEALRSLEFSKAPLSKENPQASIEAVRKHIEDNKKEIAETEKEIASFADKRQLLMFSHDFYAMRADKYQVISGLRQSKRTFVLKGFLPAEDVPALEKKLEAFDAAVDFSDPLPDDDVPVKLKNNKYVGAVEGVVESYSMPGKGEMDPAPIMATFYYICFGIMLADAAYGIIMVIATAWALKKYPHMEEGMKKFMRMFFLCGISTTFWGFMFGSFFGDAVNVIATTFFHRPDVKLPALWFEPVNKPMKMLVFSFIVGIIHLFTGLGIKFYSEWHNGDKLGAIYDAGFWYMFVGGGILYLLSVKMVTDMLGLTFTLPPAAATVAGWIAILGAIGVVFTGGRESKSWFKRILKGLYAAYGITSWLSDILSYSRLLALGLASSVISTVFNKMGSMLGGGVVGAIVFILVFVIGHTMNILINALGAYVHTNRLQYVEYFGKFYEGGGRPIEPFGQKTEYYKILEAK